MNDIHAYIDEHAGEAVGLLQEFCRQPSIAAQGHGMDAMARLVQHELASLGVDPQLVDTRGGFPVVYGHIAGQSERTLSFYNHYDVQPPDPLDEWDSDPWAADVRDGRIYARDVADN